jgi:predicted ester cyclase
MSTEDLKAKVRRAIEEGWNKGNPAVLDAVYAANVAYHHPTNPQKDLEGLKGFCSAVCANWTDMHITIHDLIAAENDWIVTRFTFEGTDTRGSVSLGTAPTGKHVKMTGIMIDHFAGGKVIEEWYEADYLGLQKQLQG